MPRTSDKSGRRQDILEALATMLETAQNKPITTAALAKQVGFSEAALYRHFPSKKRMFEGLLEFTEETLFSRIKAITTESLSTPDTCGRIILLVLAFAEKNPGISRLLTGEALNGEAPNLYSRTTALFDRVETQIKQCLREGEVKEGIRTQLTTSATAELLISLAAGKIQLFVRSGFNRLPTALWQDQWPALQQCLFRPYS